MQNSTVLNFILAVSVALLSARLLIVEKNCATAPAAGAVQAPAAAPEPPRDFHHGDFHHGGDFHGAPGGMRDTPQSRHPAPGRHGGRSVTDMAFAAIEAAGGTAEEASAAPAAPAAQTFVEFNVRDGFDGNPFDVFTGAGMLLCAGDREKCNAMTIGWGGLGTLWGRNDAVTVYVAQARHTKAFMDRAKYFTIMGFDKDRQSDILRYMGTHSGRDGDKASALGLHTAYTANGTPYYEEAQLVLECEMMYSDDFRPEGMREVPQKLYANFPAGVHSFYIGRVVKAMKKGPAASR